MLVLWKIQTSQEGLLETTIDLQRRLDKRSKETNPTETSSGMTDEVLFICNVSHHDQHWLLDSSASNHMCLHKH